MKTINMPQNRVVPKILFSFNLFFLVVWLSVKIIGNVYNYAFVGVLYELLWFPALGAFFIAVLGALLFWINDAFRLNSIYFRLLGFSLILLTLLFWLN